MTILKKMGWITKDDQVDKREIAIDVLTLVIFAFIAYLASYTIDLL